ncbi:hypothetical protein Esti_000390 [Eimeria stiedai]
MAYLKREERIRISPIEISGSHLQSSYRDAPCEFNHLSGNSDDEEADAQFHRVAVDTNSPAEYVFVCLGTERRLQPCAELWKRAESPMLTQAHAKRPGGPRFHYMSQQRTLRTQRKAHETDGLQCTRERRGRKEADPPTAFQLEGGLPQRTEESVEECERRIDVLMSYLLARMTKRDGKRHKKVILFTCFAFFLHSVALMTFSCSLPLRVTSTTADQFTPRVTSAKHVRSTADQGFGRQTFAGTLLTPAPMDEPVVSRAVLNRLKAEGELALAQRIFDGIAAFAEPPRVAASLAYDSKASAATRNVNPAKEAFVKAAAINAHGVRYADISRRRSILPLAQKPDGKAAATALAIRGVRCDFKRFSHVYADGHLLPLSVYVAALELPPVVRLQRRCYRYTPKLFELRNQMVREYLKIKRALVFQPRGGTTFRSKQNGERTLRETRSSGVTAECRAHWEAKLCQETSLLAKWEQFELRWLQENEAHAVIALQPLVSAVSAAEAILKSCKKQLILPEPSATLQRECTFRALQAFCSGVSALANALLSVESSCLFLEADALVLAAAIEAHARSKTNAPAEREANSAQMEGSSTHTQNSQGGGKEVQGVGGGSRAQSGKDWDDLHLADLAQVAKVDKEDVVVYSAKRRVLCAAKCLVACTLELLRQVWEARLCLTHMGPDLRVSRACLVAALSDFDRALANFQPPLSNSSCAGRVEIPARTVFSSRATWQDVLSS